MARTTLASTNARIDSLESRLDQIIALLEPKAPAKAVKAPAKPKVERTPVATTGFEFSGDRKGSGSKALTKGNRKAFIAAHSWAKPGMSTLTLRSLVAQGAKVNKGWNVAI